MSWLLNSEEATEQFGAHLVNVLEGSGIVFLKGDLGAGKTTLCRGVLRALGYKGAVKSPTFTLVEPYELLVHTVYHFDLYRLSDPDELNYLGVDEYFISQALCLIEWSEKGLGLLPKPDLEIEMRVIGDTSRRLFVKSGSDKGERALARLPT
jgi:tRNA threonylcarbamoyladenosine biosynthesis protein TsaE